MLRSQGPTCLVVSILLLFMPLLQGKDKPVQPLPKLEPDLPGTFHPYNVTGKNKGQFHSFITRHGLNPLVMIFVRGSAPEKPVIDLLQKLDAAIVQHDRYFLGAAVTFLDRDVLDDDRRSLPDTKVDDILKDDDRREELTKQLETDLVVKHGIRRIIIALYSEAGPKGYEIAANTEVTILLCHKHKLLERFSFEKGKMTDKDVAAILGAVKERLLTDRK